MGSVWVILKMMFLLLFSMGFVSASGHATRPPYQTTRTTTTRPHISTTSTTFLNTTTISSKTTTRKEDPHMCEKDCGCNDFTRDTCHRAHPTTIIHTDTLGDCMANCQVFALEDRCKFIIFEYEPVNQNCKLMNDDMTKYLHGCAASGQPLHNHKQQNELMEDCSNCNDCGGACMSCKDEPCFEYVDIGCDFVLTAEEISNQGSYLDCVSYCKTHKKDLTYAFYEGEQLGTCFCYTSGERHCTGTAVSLRDKDCIS